MVVLDDNSADAEEVVQEAVLKAFNSICSFRFESKFSTWLVQITIKEARMRLRKERRHFYDSIDEPKSIRKAITFPGTLPIAAPGTAGGAESGAGLPRSQVS